MRLVFGCQQRWDDANVWRRYLLTGMRRIFQTQVAMCVVGAGVDDQGKPRHVEMATSGWTSTKARKAFMNYLDMGGPAMMPDFPVIARQLTETGRYAGKRNDHIPDRIWYETKAYRQYHIPADIDDYAVVMQSMPWLGTTCSLSVHRSIGDTPFEPRHVRLLELLAGELIPLLGRNLCLKRQLGRHGLTSRQRQTLRRLEQGDSEKQIANAMDIRKTTVHEYVTDIYRYFQVRSRGELLSYFLKRKPKPDPRKLKQEIATNGD